MDMLSRWAEPLKEAEGEVDQWMAYWCRVSHKQVGQTSPSCAPARPRTATSTARRPAPAPPPPLRALDSPRSSTSTARPSQPPLLHLHRAPANPRSSTSTTRAGQPAPPPHQEGEPEIERPEKRRKRKRNKKPKPRELNPMERIAEARHQVMRYTALLWQSTRLTKW
jgi:hypothetical protein